MTAPSTTAGVTSPGRAGQLPRTLREDRWWIQPLVIFVILAAFVVYATWRAFSGVHYYSAPYLSPFYSPCMGEGCVEGSADFGRPFSFWPFSPALIILIVPLGFRMTCYYYRKSYYRAFWLAPAACAVPEPHGRYTGERRFPLILQNLHRWFLILSGVIAIVLTYDVVLAFRDENGAWGHMGLGTVFFIANVAFIWGYTLSCHSCRHLIGGRLRHFSKHPIRYRMWTWVSRWNPHHPKFAWLSLFSVALTDLYVYLLSTGAFEDPRFF